MGNLGFLTLFLQRFEGIADMHLGSPALGDVQAAVFVIAAAELLFELCHLLFVQKGPAEFLGHEGPQFFLRQAGFPFDPVLRQLVTAVGRMRVFGKAGTEAAQLSVPAFSLLTVRQKRQVGEPMLMPFFLRTDPEPLLQEPADLPNQFLGIQLRRKLQLVQQVPVITRSLLLQPENPPIVGQGEKLKKAVVFRSVFSEALQKLSRVGFLHLRKHRSHVPLSGDKRILEPQPDQILVFSGLFFLFQPAEQFFQLVIVIVPAGKADDGIPVDIGLALGRIKAKIRQEPVIRCGIPDLIVCSFFLEIRDLRRHGLFTSLRRCWCRR